MEDKNRTSSVFEESVRLAFAKAKKDILTVIDDINKIKGDMIDLRKEILPLKEKIELMNHILQKQDELSSLLKDKVETMGRNNPTVSTGTSSTGNERVLNRPEEILIRQYRMHRPQIAKRKLMELVPETGIALFDLYALFVEKEKFCGKTTFYRYIKDLCDDKSLAISLENGKRMLHVLRETTPL